MDLEITPEDLFIFCIQYFDDIEWNKFPLSDIVKPEVKNEMIKNEVTYENITEKIQII